jgi:hypothetical protein
MSKKKTKENKKNLDIHQYITTQQEKSCLMNKLKITLGVDKTNCIPIEIS